MITKYSAVSIILASAAILGGCGGGAQDAPPAGDPPPAAATGAPDAAGTPGAEVAAIDGPAAALPSPVALPTLSDKAVTTESGLKYEDTVVGPGDEAAANTLVTIHYSLYLQDGTMVDSSIERGEPITFLLGDRQVMPGWDEGVVGMKTGGKRMLVSPPDLAFGAEGHPPQMPPNATVISDIELVAVRPAPEVPEKPAEVAEYTTTESGLQYAVVQPGSGGLAEADDTVTVNYTGWLEDGTLFDSSFKRGQPLVFTLGVGDVIVGWDEGIAGMQAGEKRQLKVPGKLGYGSAGNPPKIPPNATLIFDVELVEIQ